jgi:hypothetical protein
VLSQRAVLEWGVHMHRKYSHAPSMVKAISRMESVMTSCAMTAVGSDGVPDPARVPAELFQVNLSNLDELVQQACLELKRNDSAEVHREVEREARVGAAASLRNDADMAQLSTHPDIPPQPRSGCLLSSERSRIIQAFSAAICKAEHEFFALAYTHAAAAAPPAAASPVLDAAAASDRDAFVADCVAMRQEAERARAVLQLHSHLRCSPL